MHRDWLAMEHYRLHVMEQWPDSPIKEAGLAAVRATLESLARTAPADAPQFVCSECLGLHSAAKVIQFPAAAVCRESRRHAA